ncbi:hypothetical protein NUW58_g6962 [Xylaria curta]|uniref:Uncharacterized protein n=1 Tax=Xylaria curta TaxID=42375 RepID=A0ACC1NN79_9PEZI|nr:hypothetical protein NUW58_g6962 [Xylaria curta]
METTTIFDASKSPSASAQMPQQEGTHISNTPFQSDSRGPPSENYRLMKKTEWLQFCRGIGILKDEESEEVVRATSRLWPPLGFKDGLYNDVLREKTKFTYYYHILSIIAWCLMLLQLALSAILTALGARANNNGTPITVIAAVNTSVAGILALLHNSGLPDRYRWDRNEFFRVEEHIKAIVDTGLVPASQSVNDALTECFGMFTTALQTVQNNTPSMYTPATGPNLPATTIVPVFARASQKPDPKK